jgi:hypothetical protein
VEVMFDKLGVFFGNLKTIWGGIAIIMMALLWTGDAYTDYKLKDYITESALNDYMINREVKELLREIEYLTLDLRTTNPVKRQSINDKISLINAQIRRIKEGK